MPCCSEFVFLRSGLVVPFEPFRLALDLEARGFSLSVTDDDRLLVRPRSKLTAEDLAALRRWRLHLLSIVGYEVDDAAAN